MCINDLPFGSIGPESVFSGGAVECDELFVIIMVLLVVTEWRLVSSLNHITVIPSGIDISAGSKFEIPDEVKGIVIAYDGIFLSL